MEIGTTYGADVPRTDGGARDAGAMKDKAVEVGRAARGRAVEMLGGRKDELSGLLAQVADAMERDSIGRYGSSYLRRGSDFLRQRSAEELVDSARSSIAGARERPAMLLGACFVAGLAVARMLRR